MLVYKYLYISILKRKWLEIEIKEKILNFIYPPTCGICEKINQNYLCNKCQKKLERQAKFAIQKNQSNYFNKHLYIFEYQGMIRKIILDYKFNEKSYLYRTIVNFLSKNEKFFKILKSYDKIIPAPISKERNRKRGYNQSYLIAKEIAKQAGIELENECLYKTKNIIEQSKLNKQERQSNIQGVYKIKNKNNLKNRKILLLDDIYTTGSTANECCKILNLATPKEIDVFTIAKD